MTNVTEANNDLVKIWPDVLLKSITDDRVELQLTLAPDLGYFNGHFPNSPILAGVVQLHWAVEYSKQYFHLSELEVKNVEILKFQVVITPGQTLNFTLTRKATNKILFSYSSEKGQHASGRIVFEEGS